MYMTVSLLSAVVAFQSPILCRFPGQDFRVDRNLPYGTQSRQPIDHAVAILRDGTVHN